MNTPFLKRAIFAGAGLVAATVAVFLSLPTSTEVPVISNVARSVVAVPVVSAPESLIGEVSAPAHVIEEPVPDVAPPEPVAVEGIVATRQDVRWVQSIPEPAFAKFREWTQRWPLAKTEGQKAALLAEGIAAADVRRREMADLIDKNPRRALELAVPFAVRRMLPAEIAERIEEPVRGRGDLWVAAALPMPGQEMRVRAVSREMRMRDGRRFDTYTFGERESSGTKMNIAVQGIALDGKLALSDMPGRVMEPEEVAAVKGAAGGVEPVCPTSGLLAAALDQEVAIDWDGGQPTFFCGPSHAASALAEAAAGEGGGGGDVPIAETGYTEGTKKMLIIRVDFPDAAGQVVSDATLTTLINNMRTQWDNMSYGKTTWTQVGSGSDFTPTLRLPNGHASYTDFVTMLNAARSAAADAGYNYQNYNFEVIVTGSKPSVGFGGIAYVGARGAWLANSQWNLGVCSHEVGHNFGLNHAGFWDTDDGSVIGSGSAVEYGNPFDHMGGASSSFDAHFGARQKNYLDWLADADVRKIGSDGQVLQRIAAFDARAATGTKAIAVDKAGTDNDYWIEYRGEYADAYNEMKEGVVLNWGRYSINNGKPLLLDTTPATSSKNDSAVLMGRTFSDTAGNIHITPVARGTDAVTSVRWMDVQVNRGAFAGNQKPTVSVSAGNLNPATNASVTFTAAASDPDGDAVGYYWEWGDGSYTANNSATASHAWTSTGTKTVRCFVTDMKGQTATGQLLVQVGTSSTFFIQGTITSTAGAPIEGAVVSAGSKNDTTDSEGYYAITGLAAGSYTVAAAKAGLTINPSGFTNPVAVGPSKQNINFVAPPGSPSFGTMKAGLVDQGSNSGDIALPVSDPDTALTALTLTGSSSNTAIVPNGSITFGIVGNIRTARVAAGANVSGQVNITITATDPEGSSAAYVWPVTVNARPVLTVAAKTTSENVPLDIDLRSMVTDDLTPMDKVRFAVSKVRGGSGVLQPDGHTLRFTPLPNYHGAASFALTVRDQSLSSRTLFLYDFELPDTVGDGKITDQSNHNREAAFETQGSGGEYAYVAESPASVAPYDSQSVNLTAPGSGGVRIRKTLSADELNYNDEDWTFSTWVKRSSRTTDDVIMHLGEGDGYGSQVELHLHFPANSDAIVFGKYGAAGVEASLTGPNLAVDTWHHVALVYDRTATNTGTFKLFVDGFPYGSATGVAMDIDQSFPMYLGGTQSSSASLNRYFDGGLDDAMLAGSALGDAEIRDLATMGARHSLGLSAAGSVNVTVTGGNQAPQVSTVSNAGLLPGQASGALPFVVSDAESEGRTLTVTAASSNTALVPSGGIAVSSAPAAWGSSDMGTVSAAGSMIEDHGTFIVSGSGAGIGGTSDEFRWVREDFAGDGEFIARVVSMDFTNANAKAGVMLREASNATSAYAFAYVTAGNGVAFDVRTATGVASVAAGSVNGVAAPCWLRVARTGTTYTGYYATDNGGAPGAWQQIGGAQEIPMATTPNRLGMAVTSNVDGTLCTAVFDRLGGTAQLGGERTVTITPAVGQTGTSVITLTANDGALTGSSSFIVSVTENTAPTITPVSNVTGTEGSAVPSFSIIVDDIHTAPGDLVVTSSSSNGLLLPDNRIIITGSGGSRTIQLVPIPSETGTATVTLTVSDGALTSVRTFTFTVDPGDESWFVRAGANWRFLDTGGNPLGWALPAFNDSGWQVGPAQLGFGEGDEGTPINSTSSRITTYFRHTFPCADPSAYAFLKLRILRDDGAVLYLNGQEIYRTNMPAGTIMPSTQAASSAVEGVWEEVLIVGPPLVAGANVFGVEVHQRGTNSSDLSFDVEIKGEGPSPMPVVAAGAEWRYLDDGTDPGATWFQAGFAETAAWKSGPAQLGYGDGGEATVVESGPEDAHHITTYFRRKFLVQDPAHFDQAALQLVRDDGAVVYLNGVELFRNNLPEGVITNTTLAQTAVGGADESAWQTVRFDPAWLVPGENIVAVEIHQASTTSSDVSFDLRIHAYPHNSIPSPAPVREGNNLVITWPAWAQDWKLRSSIDLDTWNDVTTPPSTNELGEKEVTLPLGGVPTYFRLEAP